MLIPFTLVPGTELKRALVHQTNFEAFFPEVNTNTSWRSILPYVEQTVEEYLLPQLGSTFYNELIGKYINAQILTDNEAAAVRFIQVCTAWYAIAMAYANKLDILTDMGNTQLNGEKSMGTPKWAFEKKYGTLLRTADKKLDNLLEFLEKNIALTEFAAWLNAPEYKNGKAEICHSTAEMQYFHNILNSRRTFLALIPTLRDVARYHIIPKIGDLYLELVAQYAANTLTSQNATLLPYVQAAAIKLALSMALETQPVQFESDGVRMVTTTEGSERVQADRVAQLANSCKILGKQFLDDMETFVLKNLTNYPTFANSPLNPQPKTNSKQILISQDRIGAIMISNNRK